VDAEKLRFDFLWNKPMEYDEIGAVDKICSDIIDAKLNVYRKVVDLSVAKTINNLRAVFGEAYPDPVTVVSVGKPVEDLLKQPDNPEWLNYSIEFCGGTHLKNSGDAKSFVTVSEVGIAKGIRRIVAFTGQQAKQVFANGEQFQRRIEVARSKKEDLSKELSLLNQDLDSIVLPTKMKGQFQKELKEIVDSLLSQKKDLIKFAQTRAEEIATKSKDQKIVVEEIDVGSDRKALNAAMQVLKTKLTESAALILSKDDKVVLVFTMVPKALSQKLNAGDWVKDIMSICEGKGGGSATDAQGTGVANKDLSELFKRGLAFANEKLK